MLSYSSENGVLASLPRHHFLRKRGCAAVAIISCTVDDVEVFSMLTNISMAALFVGPGWSTHESYSQ